ncbi:MAG: hypothetical protein JWO98_4683 [Frankiales bacterium]|nr:hypothetical protein [Frankiales bacterium]
MAATAIGPRTAVAVRAGRMAGALSRKVGLGAGAIIAGRVALRLDGQALSRLAAGRRVVLVSGTNGKTTTSHMTAAALRTAAPVAHNDTGANMPDGALAALMEQPDAPLAVIEVDELHLGAVADAVHPAAVVLLNLSRDQLDRGTEVHAVARSLAAALRRHPDTLVVANADDPVVVGAVQPSHRVVWVAAGMSWLADAGGCPRCGRRLETGVGPWRCTNCGMTRPTPTWGLDEGAVRHPGGRTEVRLTLPGRFNLGNAAFAMAAADALGVPPDAAATAIAGLGSIAGRYGVHRRGPHELRLMLAKNPAGWAETLPLLADARAVLLVVNAREADGRDTSWLWDVPFEQLPDGAAVAVAGERAADVGLRLSYADVSHATEPDPLAALALLPPGQVQVVANYTAFLSIRRRLATEEAA